jgi:hypothetical protein
MERHSKYASSGLGEEIFLERGTKVGSQGYVF